MAAVDLNRAERLAKLHEEAVRAREATGLMVRRCPNCSGVMGEYEAPVKLYRQKCRHCGLYSELTTETPG